MEQKRAKYFASGSALVWIYYPETRTVEVRANPQSVVTLGQDAMLTGGPVLPEFSVRVGDIFDSIDFAYVSHPAENG